MELNYDLSAFSKDNTKARMGALKGCYGTGT